MFVDMRVVSICVGLGVALGAPGGGSLLGVRRARFRGYAEEISEPTDVDSSTDEEEESTTPMPDDDDEDQSTSTESEVTTTTKKSVKSNKNGKSNDGKSNDGKSNDGKSNDGKSNDGKSSEKDKKKGGKGGKFKGYKEAIAFVVSKDFDEIFASNLIFQLIKYRNGDAALDNSLVSQVVDALSVCKPELEVIADLRNSTETNSGSTRGMMAKTLSTAVRRYYLNADSQGQSTKLIRHVVIVSSCMRA